MITKFYFKEKNSCTEAVDTNEDVDSKCTTFKPCFMVWPSQAQKSHSSIKNQMLAIIGKKKKILRSQMGVKTFYSI